MDDIIIREARPEDGEKMLAYLKQIGGETDNLTFGPEGLPLTLEEEQAYIRRVQEDPRSVMYCAWRGEELVGDASLSSLARRMSHRGKIGISVVKSAWHQGVGTRLMEALIRYARAAGLEILNLEVRKDNERAIGLYRKFGFRSIGTFPHYLKVNGVYGDVELMYLDLREK